MLEETIVRGALQGLIDDSKIVDKLCKKLGCHRTEVLDKVNDNFALETDAFPITKEEVERAKSILDDLIYKTQESKSQVDYALDEAKDAEDLASDLEYKFDHWNTLIREHEESKEPVTLEPEIENEDILKVPAKEVSANNIQTQ